MSDDFFDTNVLIYLLSADAKKADRAEALVRQGGAISVQVLNEAANVARRKLAMDWRETRAFLALLSALLAVARRPPKPTPSASISPSVTSCRSMTR